MNAIPLCFSVFRFIGIVMLHFSFRYLVVSKPNNSFLSLLYLDRYLDFPQMSAFYFAIDFIDFQIQVYSYSFQMNFYSLQMYSY